MMKTKVYRTRGGKGVFVQNPIAQKARGGALGAPTF